ncbi:MAG TPA: class I SAM-dependent methyltransferase [Terracidiphilus sp.]|jgi:ubiquinone/menaquinone biosynthesis C-methylase UbiE|nr:class I SAM-dependent methyltransferase [Terracidiphilus sp.]
MSATPVVTNVHAAGSVFDRLAPSYDDEFTDSLIGRAQRNSVWNVLLKTFRPGDNILEINCGTGEDALFLARNRISVTACDASQAMIARARQRLMAQPAPLPVVFSQLPTERINELAPPFLFDGAFSNFSGLNCIEDLAPVAASLSHLIKDGGRLLLCFSTRVCLTEIFYYLARGQKTKALRRLSGRTRATLDGLSLDVYYPGLARIRRSFSPHFQLRSTRGIGVMVPPSYLEPWARNHPTTLRLLCHLEDLLARVPFLRSTGDHVLLCFEKVSP